MNSVGISLSGMQAASQQLSVSANNIANANSTSTAVVDGESKQQPYQSQTLLRQSVEPTGGVRTELRSKNATNVTLTEGVPNEVAQSDVNVEQEMVNAQMASYDYKANLKVMETLDGIMQSLLDVTA